MKSHIQSGLAGFMFGAFLIFSLSLQAQGTNQTSATPVGGRIIRVGGDVVIQANETNQAVFVLGGNAVVRGTVQGGVVVVSGTADVTGTVDGDVAVVAGTAKLSRTAQVKRNLITLGSALQVDPSAKIDLNRIQLTVANDFNDLRWLANWVTHGLLRARPFPPQLGWVWAWIGVFLGLHILLAAVFPQTTQTTVNILGQRPVGSFFTGLLVLFLAAPLAGLLLISGVGVTVLPFLACAIVAALVLGKLALFLLSGRRLGGVLKHPVLLQPVTALVVGSAVFYVLYMIPVVGFLALGLATTIGLGAAVLTVISRLRQESAVAVAAGVGGAPAPLPVVLPLETAPVTEAELAQCPRAGFWRRLAATVLDFCLLIILLTVFRRIALLIWIAYHVCLWATTGTTVGGVVLGLKIVREDGRPLGWGVALARALTAMISALVFLLGFFWAGWSRTKQSWHDKIAGTLVVKVPRGTALM